MKHVKFFAEFINEMEIGKTLFSRDVEQKSWEEGYLNTNPNKKYVFDLLSSMKDKNELNTSDELRFLKFIETYVHSPHLYKKIDSDLLKNIKDLQKLKKKYPLILDPTEEKEKVRYAWRGASVQTDELVKLIKNAKFINETEIHGDPGYHVKVNGKVSTRSDKKFISFTTRYYMASRFYLKQRARYNNDPAERSECILEVPKNSPQLLFNPDFMDMFSPFNEKETWYINNTGKIDISGIYISSLQYEYLKKENKI